MENGAQIAAFYDNSLLVIESNTLEIHERDRRCIDEYLNYEKKPNGSFGARHGCHDDLLMTRAIGLHICFYEMPHPQIINVQNTSLKYTPKVVSAASF